MNNEIKYVSPFKRFCITVGNLPTAYLESMSYYEGLTYLVNYLSNNVIPALNNNSAVVEELQEQFTILKNYVDNYFDNLDVQEEINNKLDKMVEDGTLENILSSIVNQKSYATTLEMIADTTIPVNYLISTSGYSSINDGKGGTYFTVESSTRDGYLLDNGLFAEVIENDGIKRNQNSTVNSFNITSNKISGVTKALANGINQESDKDYCINLNANDNVVENLYINNSNNYSNKTAIKTTSPSQRNKINSIFIGNNFKTGIDITSSNYSQINDAWIKGETGLKIGNTEHPEYWTGVIDINSSHINDCKLAINEISTDTNTICIDKSSFEHNEQCIKNSGKIYVRNTYFGDTNTSGTEKIEILEANPNSETHFTNCTLGIDTKVNDNALENTCTIFNLKSQGTTGSRVYVDGGILNISNNNLSNHYSSIYESDNENNELYLDNVKFIIASNYNHNVLPFKVFNHSPLRSKNPIQNYIIGGCLRNPVQNDIYMNYDDHPDMSNYVENLVNPFGGKILEYNRINNDYPKQFMFKFKIPKELVGKKMTLETYVYDGSANQILLNSTELGLNNSYLWQQIKVDDDTRTSLYRLTVTPTKQIGTLTIRLHQSAPIGTKMRIFGVILKEYCYRNNLSCYKDLDIMISNKTPTNTTEASTGDIVYYPNMLRGWIFDGTAWQDYSIYSANNN